MPWREMSMMSERLEFIRLAMKEGANRRELCRRFNIHPDTGYKWIWRFREGADLTDRSRRPHTSPGRTSSFVLPPASANWVAGKKPPETLRSRAEGIQQDDEKVLLVSNIKVDGEPIGAFGEGEFWFHIDARLYSEAIPLLFLFALELPSTGGNTLFSNMYLAHDSLPQELKEKLLGKRALHIHEYNRAKQPDTSGDISSRPHCYHPVFITHPETGRKSLFVDRLMTTAIEGMSQSESAGVLEQLYAAGERRQFIYEHVWRPGDFVMWDNYCTIHAWTDFPRHERRLLRRCTVEGQALQE